MHVLPLCFTAEPHGLVHAHVKYGLPLTKQTEQKERGPCRTDIKNMCAVSVLHKGKAMSWNTLISYTHYLSPNRQFRRRPQTAAQSMQNRRERCAIPFSGSSW